MTLLRARRRLGLALALTVSSSRALANPEAPEPTPPGSPSTVAPRAESGLSALVPSRESERAARLAQLEKDLGHTLASIDGVESARVHIAVPQRDPFDSDDAPPPSASVLLRSAADLGMSDSAIRSLVAGAVPRLDPTRVSILRVAAKPPPTAAEFVRVGPFFVAAASASPLKAAISLLAALNVGWVFLMLGARFRKRAKRPSPIARQAR